MDDRETRLTLEPCPFCGGPISIGKTLVGEAWAIDCEACDCAGRPYPTKAEAIATWNVRTLRSVEPPSIISELLNALKGVVAVSDRKTVEYDRAHAVIAKAAVFKDAETNEHTGDMRRVLLMALQLAHSGNHDGKSENCPTCHVVKEARKIGIVFDAETGAPLR